ncbi:MAG: hypothetical protein KBT44_03425 [Bacteroidales bacterium]|nr:hypothetical protein [Candidatus Equibacterium intestinale]
MVTITEYVFTMLFWIPLSVICAVIIYLGFFTINMFDIAVCGIMFVFGITRVILSSLQVNGRRFYGRRDLFDIWSAFVCLFIVLTMIYLGHVDRGRWLKALPSFRVLACMGAVLFMFLYVIIKAIRKYRRTKRALSLQ